MSAFLASALPVAARAPTRRPTPRRVARARAVAVPRVRRVEVPATLSDMSLPSTARPTPSPASSLDAAHRHPPTDPNLDLGKVAVGSAALFCLAVAHPDPAFAREVTLDLPDFATLPDISDPADLLGFIATNPYAAVAASVAAYLVIPKAAELLVKYFLLPAIVLAVAAGAAQHPDETVALVANAINQARDHPTVTSGVILAVLAVALSPYILVAALVGLLVSGVQLLPDALKPALPGPVREVEARVEQLQRAVTPGVEQAKALRKEANARAANLKTEVEQAKARADAERARRREAERVEAERRAAEAEERARAKIEELVAPVVAAQRAAEDAAESVAGAAKETVEAVEAVGEGARSTTRCSSRPTAEARSACVDEQRAARRAAEARSVEERKAQAERLRAESARRAAERDAKSAGASAADAQ
jgi:hypothetical protein